jgi:hypothetical protein
MHAPGALGATIGHVEGDIDPIVPWQERVGVIESKRVRGAQETNIVECMDGMCFTKGLGWWLVLLGGERGEDSVRYMNLQSSYDGTEPVFRTIYPNVTSRRTHEY